MSPQVQGADDDNFILPNDDKEDHIKLINKKDKLFNVPIEKKGYDHPQKGPIYLPPSTNKPEGLEGLLQKLTEKDVEKVLTEYYSTIKIESSNEYAKKPRNRKEKPKVREPKPNDNNNNNDSIDWSDPNSIKSYLDRFVYNQEDAKRALSVAFADYMSLGKPSHSLMIGPSGTGKTYMLSVLCDAAQIPFVKKSMANLSSEGYKGENLGEILETLKRGFGEPAEKAIIFLDEFDKLALLPDSTGNENYFPRKLQQELLAWFTGEVVHGVDTSKYLIVGAGAFSGDFGRQSLYEIIQKRLGGSQAKVTDESLLENLVDSDLVEYGLMPELVGRLTNKAALSPVDEEGLYRILKDVEDSPVQNAIKDFEKMGITLDFSDGALKEIARIATQGVGVRGLHGIVNGLIENYSFDRKKYKGKTIKIDKKAVKAIYDKKTEFVEPDEFEIDWRDPRSIVQYLDQYVAGQEDAKKELAKAFHLYHLGLQDKTGKMPKSNIMLIGPSGSGKTYMVELLAKKAQLPMGKTNTTGKVPNGVPGEHYSDVFEQFGRSEQGIVYIDEVDKVLLNPEHPMNNELIGLIENGEVNGRNTGKYLFILSGAFQPLYDAMREQRIQAAEPKVGFNQEEQEVEQAYEGLRVTRDILQECNVSREILGRVPIISNVNALTVDDLTEILTKRNSVLEQYIHYFDQTGKNVDIEPDALRAIAESAHGLQGARALGDVANRLFDHYIMNAADYKADITITGEEARRILQ